MPTAVTSAATMAVTTVNDAVDELIAGHGRHWFRAWLPQKELANHRRDPHRPPGDCASRGGLCCHCHGILVTFIAPTAGNTAERSIVAVGHRIVNWG